MSKKYLLNDLGIEPEMTYEEVARAIAEEEGSDKPLSLQRIRAIEKSAFAKIAKNPEARRILEEYLTINR